MIAVGATLWVLVTGAPDFVFDASLRAETRGGKIPLAVGLPAYNGLDLEVLPQARLTVIQDAGRLSLGYGPRVFRRFYALPDGVANPTDEGLLLLHSAELAYRYGFSRSWQFTASGAWQRGATDYGALTNRLGGASGNTGAGANGSAGGPSAGADGAIGAEGTASSLSIQTLVANVGIEGAIDAVQRITFGAHASEVRSVRAAEGVSALPRSVTFGGDSSYEQALTRRDLFRVGATVDFVHFDALNDQPAHDFTNVSTQLGLERALTESARLGGQLGLLLIHSRETGAQLQPIGALSFSFSPFETRQARGQANLSAGVDGFANPLLGTFQTRLNLGVGLAVTAPPDWSFGLTGSLITPLDEQGANAGTTDTLVGQTVFSAAAPIGYRIDENFRLEFGARFSALAPRFDAPNFRLESINLVAFLAVTLAIESVL